MGKMMYMISIIVFVDLIFISLWGGSTSVQSILFNWLSDPTNFDKNFVIEAIKSLFLTISIGAAAAIVVFRGGAKTDTVLFATFAAGVLLNVSKDYLFMYHELTKINALIATFVMVPFMIMFAFIVIDWLKNRD